jgi:S-adenosylmethionine:tRNA ribosyltransferase-isomerase
MNHPASIQIDAYNYPLPAEKIALTPLTERDASKLLLYKNGAITEDVYKNISAHLPENTLLIFNNTKVVNARLLYKKSTGASIEIFCLEPIHAHAGYEQAMNATTETSWKCLVGGISKWKEPTLEFNISINHTVVRLFATLQSRESGYCVIHFNWEGNFTFSCILEHAGKVPLPPYIKRAVSDEDVKRYQTTFAEYDGSVAAPTAGLHFTPDLMDALKQKFIETDFVTLHVGAGTFKPVTANKLEDHEMHGEWLMISFKTLQHLIEKPIRIAVGTTSLRTLETLYWMGVKLHLNPNASLSLSQWEVYAQPLYNSAIPFSFAMKILLEYMSSRNLEYLYMQTHILIAPGYRIRSVQALITNFHQPQSTLLLLVAAGVGNDWKKIYTYALNNNFRFLSYGDGSLLFFPTVE